MKFFIRSRVDAMFAINRCYFEADHGHAKLAIDRLGDLADEIPGNPHILYAQGMVWRDHLGQGRKAFECFKESYELAAGLRDKRETARLAAYNATMLAPDVKEFRRWADLATEACRGGHREDQRALRDLLAELERGIGYCHFMLLRAKDEPGPAAAVLEVALQAGGMTQQLELECRKDRAAKLRDLDRKDQQLRENVHDTFPPDERLALHEALRELEKMLVIDESDATFWNFKASWLSLLERHEEAVAAADRAIELRPHRYARPHVNKAYSLYHLGRQPEAIACIREALRQAEEERSPEQIEQAKSLLHFYSQPRPHPTSEDLRGAHLWVVEVTSQIARKELAHVRQGGITIEMVVKRLLGQVHVASSQMSKAYVPLVAQLLGDFTPETAFVASAAVSERNREAGRHLFWAVLYLVAHSQGVQRRDAARLLTFMALTVSEDPEAIRQFYRWNVLEPSAAATDEMSQLGVIVRDQLNRINPHLPRVLADQDPVDEAGRQRARRLILSQFTGPAPEPIHSQSDAYPGCVAVLLTAVALISPVLFLAWQLFLRS